MAHDKVTVLCFGKDEQESFDCNTFQKDGKTYYHCQHTARYIFEVNFPITRQEIILHVLESPKGFSEMWFMRSDEHSVRICPKGE